MNVELALGFLLLGGVLGWLLGVASFQAIYRRLR